MEFPRIWFEGCNGMGGVVGVVPMPREVVDICGGIFESSGGGVFPFGFSGESEFLAGFFGEPLAKCIGGLSVNADGWIAFVPVSAVRGTVWLRRAGANDFVFGGFFLAEIETVCVDVVNIPSDFGLSDQDGFDGCFFAVIFVGSGGNAHHGVFGEVAFNFDD